MSYFCTNRSPVSGVGEGVRHDVIVGVGDGIGDSVREGTRDSTLVGVRHGVGESVGDGIG
jgi:hypothetical protein